ncbi:MAG: PepSY domain-containing protein [Phycisphaerae bacterium]|nr:PepSY domain-containing protein [Phycisphaerae bacterium]
MTEDEAIAVVRRERAQLDIDPDMEVASAEQAIVEYMKDRTRPGVVEDRVAWIVELSSNEGFVLVHVDDQTGEILEVLRTA